MFDGRLAINRIILLGAIISSIGISLLIVRFNRKLSKPPSQELKLEFDFAFLKEGRLIFYKKDTKDSLMDISIEFAKTDIEKANGLMWRKHLADTNGMLFIFEGERQISMWMKNTYVSLDIIYVNNKKEIVDIHEKAKPLDQKLITSKRPACFAIEVTGGFCNKYGIQIGDWMSFSEIEKYGL